MSRGRDHHHHHFTKRRKNLKMTKFRDEVRVKVHQAGQDGQNFRPVHEPAMAGQRYSFDDAIIRKDAKENPYDINSVTCKHVPIHKTFVHSNVLHITKFHTMGRSSIGRHITTMPNPVLLHAGNDFPHELSLKQKNVNVVIKQEEKLHKKCEKASQASVKK